MEPHHPATKARPPKPAPSDSAGSSSPRRSIFNDDGLRIALIYAIVAANWIIFSDSLLTLFFSQADVARITHLQSIKGCFFVATTSIMLYLLVRHTTSKLGRSQRAQRESEERFRRLVDWSPDAIFVQTAGRFVYVNRAMVDLLDFDSADALIGLRVFDVVHRDFHEIVRSRLGEVDSGSEVPLIEERWLRSDGSLVWVEVAARPLEFQGTMSVQGIVRDISIQKRATEALSKLNEQLERRVIERTRELEAANEDLRTFSYIITHDLRTPLQSITRFARSALSDAEDSERGTHPTAALSASALARRTLASVVRLDRLIAELYDYAQLARSEIQPQRISLTLLCHEVVGQLMREPAFEQADITIREPMPWVLVHRPTLALVLQNLIVNAVTFVGPSTRPLVTIRTESAAANRSGGAGPMTRVVVEDNGLGIDESRVTNLFHFFDAPEKDPNASPGSGLGLAIVRRGVERMGGRVGIESTPGVGSRFWVELPKDPESP